LHTTAISSEEVEVPVPAMISLVRFRICILIQVLWVFPRPVQLLQAGFLLLRGLEQLLSMYLQLECGRWCFWRRRGRHEWKRWPHMDFHRNTITTSSNERGETR
jgi:hypothetical protein